MRKFYKSVSVVLVCILSLALISCSSSKNASIALVNGEKITKEEFSYFLTSVKAQIESEQGNGSPAALAEDFWETVEIDGQKVIETAKEKALEEVVKVKVARQKAVEAGVKITSAQREDINNRIGKLIASYGKDGVDAYLGQYGLNQTLFEKQLEDSFYRQNLTEQLTESVSETDAKAFFDSKVARVKHILIMTVDQQTQEPLPAETVEAAKIKADEILEKAKSGDDFDALVAEYSEDPGSQAMPDGYYLGKGFALGQQGGMVPAFETASLELAVGAVSDIVETNYGYHIIKRYENAQSEYDANADEVLQRAKNAEFDTLLDGWKNDAKIEKNEKEYNAVK
ncbi:MAG: peptidylprolyl isomerase [Clostridiales bacterium]|jgi:foldase protein PrsA|nr:peptidylprolyl isomerase [Clostridiales bacterium]